MTTYADRISAIVARHPDHPGAVELLQIAAEMRVDRAVTPYGPLVHIVPSDAAIRPMLVSPEEIERAATYAVPAAYSAPPKPEKGQRWRFNASGDVVTLVSRVVAQRRGWWWQTEEGPKPYEMSDNTFWNMTFVDHGLVAPHEASGSLL